MQFPVYVIILLCWRHLKFAIEGVCTFLCVIYFSAITFAIKNAAQANILLQIFASVWKATIGVLSMVKSYFNYFYESFPIDFIRVQEFFRLMQ